MMVTFHCQGVIKDSDQLIDDEVVAAIMRCYLCHCASPQNHYRCATKVVTIWVVISRETTRLLVTGPVVVGPHTTVIRMLENFIVKRPYQQWCYGETGTSVVILRCSAAPSFTICAALQPGTCELLQAVIHARLHDRKQDDSHFLQVMSFTFPVV